MNSKLRRRYVHVEGQWVQRCWQYGQWLVQHYASGGSPNSRAVSGSRGTESNVERQMQGKLGEVAVALYCSYAPGTHVKWERAGGDAGFDLLIRSTKVDVKTTFPPFKLIWSNTVNNLWTQKRFDALVSVSVERGDWENCYIEGWISKREFFNKKQIADGCNCNLEKGTWFMDKRELNCIDELLTTKKMPGFVGYDENDLFSHYCHCGKWGSFGFGVQLRKDKLGKWYCAEHAPTKEVKNALLPTAR